MWRGHCHLALCAAVLACAWLSFAHPSAAQLRAGAAIAVTATLPSSVTLSDNLLPITLVVANGTASVADLPLNLKWNINPRETTGFRITATVIESPLSTGSLEVRISGTQFRPFPGSKTIALMNKVITPATRMGDQKTSIQIRISDAAVSGMADGVYSGWLKLDAQIL